MKKLLAALTAMILMFSSVCYAQSYVNAGSRINFYYQHDGGGRSERGRWDRLLADRLLALTGHDCIYPYSDKFLTGRGCCLFAFAHAYQYLQGYAPSERRQADILYEFLKIKPVWSNTNSSVSPPNAHSLYAAYLAKQPGVSRYSGSLDTFAKLRAFFEGNKGVIIVNAPGHYVIAVGAVKQGGVEYVQIVDSLISATVRDGRITKGKSMDFSVTYTQSNAALYEASVHEYWIPYSELASKCKLRHAFTVGTAPVVPSFCPDKSAVIVTPESSQTIRFENCEEELLFESLDESVCAVSDTGEVCFVSEGTAQVQVTSLDDPRHECMIDVYCLAVKENALELVSPGQQPLGPFDGAVLPAGAHADCLSGVPGESGLYEADFMLVDPYGDAICPARETLAVIGVGELLAVPDGVKLIEAEAFEGTGFLFAALPESVAQIESGAFSSVPLKAVFAANPWLYAAPGAFPEGTRVFYDYGAYLKWLSR